MKPETVSTKKALERNENEKAIFDILSKNGK